MSDRVRIVLLALVLCAAFAVAWFYLGLFSAFHCGGDGGAPYAARDSTVGKLCHARDHGPLLVLWLAGLVLAPLVVLGGAVAAVARSSRRVLLRCAAIGFAVLAFVTLPFLVLGSRCSDEQVANGGDCETY